MRKLGSIILGTIFGISLIFMGGSAAVADPNNFQDLKLTVFGFNAVGTDQTWNRNEEYVWFKNVSGEEKDITGWYLTDSRADMANKLVFADDLFPHLTDGKLPAGHSVIVYTGTGNDANDNDRHAVYRNHGHYWNNGGDVVSLVDADGTLIERLSYSDYGINPTP